MGCPIDNCGKRIYARGWCRMHYARWQRSRPPEVTCSLDGCIHRHYARGWCNTHYLRWRNTGDPLGSLRPTDDQRLWSKLDVGHPLGCWEWTGALDSKGYGQTRYEGRLELVHRLVYRLLMGEVPPLLDHLCRNTICANPDHLEPVTNAENVRRGFWGLRSRCKGGHEYTPQNTRVQGGTRICRACERDSQRRYLARKAVSV